MDARRANAGLTGNVEQIQTAFFTATFSVMGHIAKADGQVSEVEIFLAEDVMRQMELDTRQTHFAQRLFNEGKKEDFPLEDVLHQFRFVCHRRTNLLQMFMEIQIALALSDGTFDPSESRILEKAASILGFDHEEYLSILHRMQAQRHAHSPEQAGMSLADAYSLLEVDRNADDQEVKKAYRRQMNRHHPDKLVSKGLPEEMMEIATRKTQDIKAAYELVKKSRKN